MNTITDMEYRIFNFKKGYRFTILFALMLFLASTGFSKHTAMILSAPPPTPIVANPDTGFVNSYSGNSTLLNIFANDSFNNVPVVGSAMKVTVAPTNSHISVDTLTGIVSVTPGIPAGVYSINYSICDTSDLSNCSATVLIINVSAPIIIANTESASVNGYNGSVNLLDVFANDSIHGNIVTAGSVTASIVTAASHAGITLNVGTGIVSVAANTISGNYSIVYRICDTLNTSNCDTSIVYITVLPPPIIASPDYVAVNSYNGGLNILNIYANDSINNITVTPGRVTLSVLSAPSEPGIFLNSSNGRVSVFPMTPAGIYTFIYRICDTLNTANCDTALITLNVYPPPIIANDDNGTVNGYNGNSNLLNVFSNDSLNNKGTSLGSVNLSVVTTAGNPGIVLNLTTGIVNVGSGIPAGLYTIVYKICDTLNAANCDTGIISINVSAPLIRAKADNGSVNGNDGNPALLNVLSNDSLNGAGFIAGAVNLSLLTAASHSGIVLNLGTGVVSVAGIIPAGIYTLQYKICDTLNPGNCDSAIATINVTAPVIVANSDNGSVNGTGNLNLLNVLSNDSFNSAPAQTGKVLITVVTPASFAGITLDTLTGIVSVTPAPTGSYSIVYRLCDSTNTGNCDTSIVFVTVVPPAIDATHDTTLVDGYSGSGTAINVLANDSLGGNLINSGAVYISILVPSGHPGIVLNTLTGFLSVASHIPADTFSIQYKICDTLNPLNCDSAILYIQVVAPVMDAVNDSFYVNGYNGSLNLLKVISNDRIGADTVHQGPVIISVITPSGYAGIVLDTATGFVNVNPLLPLGTYTIKYLINDTLNAGNMDSAIALITIIPPPIVASTDIDTINGYNNYPALLNVLNNDSINNIPATAAAISLNLITPASHPGILLNDTTGIISIVAPVPPGIYTISYDICDTFYTGSCDTTTDTIRVISPAIIALNDSITVSGYNVGFGLLNVLANDTMNNTVITAALVNLKVLSPASNPGVTLDTATGFVIFTSRIPAGIYYIEYRIADSMNASNCDTALIKIEVNAPTVIAVNDTALVDGYTGSSSLINVLTNDRVNGVQPVLGTTIKLSVFIGSGQTGIELDTNTGFLNVAPYTTTGNYTITYIISDTLNAGNSDTATLLIQILNPLVFANPDYASINGYDGNLNLLNVFSNDSFSSTVVTPARVNFTLVTSASHPGVVLNMANGRISVFPMTPAGIYTIVYRICDTMNTTNCDTALVSINVSTPVIRATNDSGTVNGYTGATSLLNIFTNDTIHLTVANAALVKLKVLIPFGNAGLKLDTVTGIVSVAQPVPAGIYTMQYQICDTLNTANCATAFVILNISAPSIVATHDTGTVIGYAPVSNLVNIFTNDSIHLTPANASIIKLKVLLPFGNPLIMLDTLTGIVGIGPAAAAGIYILQYEICDTLNPGNCDTAYVNVSILAPSIIATNDTGYVSGYTGSSTLLNVLNNDSINGNVADTGSANIYTLIPSGNAGVLLDTITGIVSVAPATPAGIYTIQYRISDTVDANNCDTAIVVINVGSGILAATDDTGITNGYPGMIGMLNVLDNDSLNGAIAYAGLVKLQLLTGSGNPGVTLDTLTGIIDIAPRTAAGTYSICYIITDTLNLSNSDTACVDITVYALGPVANPDFVYTGSGTAIVIDPLINDFDMDTNINIASINIMIPPLHGIALADTNTGTITYTPDITWAGDDTLYYSICDSGMVPVLCDTSFIVINTRDSLSVNAIFTTDLKCYGDSNGSVGIIVQGGYPPYNISWNTVPVQTGNIAINLKAGIYMATITDTSNKSIAVSVTINEPLPLSAVNSNTEPKCYGNFNGSININVNGGTPPYTYFWNTGSIMKDLANISSGNYNVTITDSNGCILQKSVTLSEPAPLSISAVTIKDVVCKSSPEGAIVLSVTGGVLPYKYLWNTGDTGMNLRNVPNGQYIITVTDSNVCTSQKNYTINYSKESCENDVFIPQGFSPDEDGTNDVFKIEGIEKYPDNYLRIYNRWGGLVFEMHGYNNTWKGTVEAGVVIGGGDQRLPTGTYFYILDLAAGIKTISGYFYISK
ncbi:MAG: gliding motility-associated C-terminal domain-containing protein [Bacteroidota bacterium]|nr:gliding motility-associated C-terminal domain-containing protein [Bacteroidota bacterium]